MDLMTNTLLVVGASPAMLHSLQEILDFTPQAHAPLINVGTLSNVWLLAMTSVVEFAIQFGRPWVLDLVTIGATRFQLNMRMFENHHIF